MANFNKKLGTVLACWGVALVMVITGVCLALTLPSSAAGEKSIAVTFNGATSYYANLDAAFKHVNTLATTADNRALVQLQQDIVESGIIIATANEGKHVDFDFNGQLVTANNENANFVTLSDFRFVDSQPTVVHELSNGETMIGGGFFADGDNAVTIWNAGMLMDTVSNNCSNITLTIDGGNFMGNGSFGTYGNVVMNSGNVTWSHNLGSDVPLLLLLDGKNDHNISFTMNGGYLVNAPYIISLTGDSEINDEEYINFGKNIEQGTTADEKVCYYTKEVSAPEEPVIPEEPRAPVVTEQPANNNWNTIGLIILAAAAVVMVVGVIVIILVNAKRRDKKAA